MITPHISKINGALLAKNDDLRPAYQRLTGLYWQKTMIAPRISKINGALLAKNDDCAPWIKIEAGTCVQVPTPVSLLYFQLSSAMSLA